LNLHGLKPPPGLEVRGQIVPRGLSVPSPDPLHIEQICTTIETVKGGEFLRRLKSLARRKRLAYRWRPARGVGSHGTVYLGGRFTVVKDPKKELGRGLLSDMCKQLGIQKEDL
jgi:predicted RNA binding protein YcfA (HicA-like mRNA interferase family)